jgi:predicted GH43/DUF377 family glycosyl hydrolase
MRLPPTCLIALLAVAPAAAQDTRPRAVIEAQTGGKAVAPEVMARVYDEVKTPFKYGVFLRGAAGELVDCPTVFRHAGSWYMIYISMNKIGYETHLASSADLLSWTPLGKILPFRKGAWDASQAAGFVALEDTTWGGSQALEMFDGRYWLTYCGGALAGYETDPLAIGVAWTHTPARALPWTRLEGPVLCRDQPDTRAFERLTQYRSNVIHDSGKSLGHRFVMFYNAKTQSGYERIGMAVSDDMAHWLRYGRAPVIDNGQGISGDPQIVRIGDVWVMFYFGAFWKPKAFDTFACSYDLVRWTKWQGPHLVEPSQPWDAQFAHKPWVLEHDGVVYHYYCAVGDQGRVIALATSKDLRTQRPVAIPVEPRK